MRTPNYLNEQEWLADIQKGTSQAIQLLYGEPYRIAFSILLKQGISYNVIPDLLQDVMGKFIVYVGKPDFTLEVSVKSLFCYMARCKGRKYRRDRDRKPIYDFYNQSYDPMLEIADQADEIYDEEPHNEKQSLVEAYMKELDAKVQKIMKLKFVEGKSYKEIVRVYRPDLFDPEDEEAIAELAGNFRKRVSRNMKSLRKKLGL